MPDQALVPQLGQDTEVLGDGVEAVLTEVHDVEDVPSEVAQIRLDKGPQLIRRRQTRLGRPDLRRDDQILRVRRQRTPNHLVRPAETGELQRPPGTAVRRIEVGGVEVVDAQLDRVTQQGDRLLLSVLTVAAGETLRAEADALDRQVAN